MLSEEHHGSNQNYSESFIQQDSESDDDKWTCEFCTFRNKVEDWTDKRYSRCDMCQ